MPQDKDKIKPVIEEKEFDPSAIKNKVVDDSWGYYWNRMSVFKRIVFLTLLISILTIIFYIPFAVYNYFQST